MSYRRLLELPDHLAMFGVDFITIDGWQERAAKGEDERDYTPVGLLNHHTAGPAWYPVSKLLTKCNLYIDPAGMVHVVSSGYQYDSGYGDPNVLYRVRNGLPIEPPQDTVVADRINGNPWFIDIEVGHPGDGSPIPPAQRGALIRTNAAICHMMGFDPATQVIGHKEWTRRKIDPRWSSLGHPDSMDFIRIDTMRALEDWKEKNGMPKEQWEQLIDALFAGRPDEFQGNPDYWKGLDPDSPEWGDFWAAFVRVISA